MTALDEKRGASALVGTRIRVAHVVDCFGAGGIASGVRMLMRLTEDRVDHTIISLSDDLRLLAGLHPEPSAHVLKPGPTRLIGFTARLASLARRGRIDVLHCNNQFAWLDAALAARIVGVPCLQTFHGVERPARELVGGGCWKCRSAVRLGSVVTAVGEASRRMVRTLSGAAERDVEVIPNGVDLDRFRPLPPGSRAGLALREELGVAPGAGLAVHVAGLRAVKDQATLLRAWRFVVDRAERNRRSAPVLLMIGEGPRRDELQRLAESLGVVGSVRFLGQRRDVETILPACDLFVLSSLSEGLSFAVLEAMACGLPVVATRVGGNGELVEEGRTGLLTPPRDPEALAEPLTALLDGPAMRLAMGERAREFVERRHDAVRWAERYVGLYQELIDGSFRTASRREPAVRPRCEPAADATL